LKAHTKIYLNHFGYDVSDFIPCEICGKQAVDIHHIDCKGMGGSKQKDVIDNIMAVCRNCHIKFGDKKQFKEYLIEVHKNKLNGGV
jgi:ribosome-binding protein aMBF1 (putative translation factor)